MPAAATVILLAAVLVHGFAGEGRREAPANLEGKAGAVPGTSEENDPGTVETEYVRALGGRTPGRNDSTPVWSPDGSLLSFERSRGDRREIVVARQDGTIVETVFHEPADGDGMAFLLSGGGGEASYNAGVTWSPRGDGIVYMSNGGEGNYDLYLRILGGGQDLRLTDHAEKEGHAHWSPASDNQVVFVSGRTGKGDVYLMDLSSRRTSRLSSGGKAYLYPRWSPDGRRIAVTYGTNENHDIYLIDNVSHPGGTMRALTTWAWDDIRPVWSPDGTKIAFYSNYNPGGEPGVWSIFVVDADEAGATGGDGTASRLVAEEVIPDVESGPAWMPDSNRIVYVKNDRYAYNPMYIVDLRTMTRRPVDTGTKMNHDVACSPDGLIAFRAQVDQWDRMFVARLKERVER